MAKSINIYKSISDYNDGYDERKNISISLIIDDEEEEIVDSHVKSGFVTFTAEENNSTIGLEKLSTNQTLEYKTDASDWTNMNISTTIALTNVGDKVYLRGVLSGDNTLTDYTQFKMTGKIAAIGECNALWNKDDLNAPLKECCGVNMFRGCTGLTQAPELPATTLANSCYNYMFYGCTGLIQAPVLPATKLKTYCYRYMFNGCSNLNYIKCLVTNTSSITYNWVSGVASTGTFVKSSGVNWKTGARGIPSGWDVVDAEV